jgi:hypothetical protein
VVPFLTDRFLPTPFSCGGIGLSTGCVLGRLSGLLSLSAAIVAPPSPVAPEASTSLVAAPEAVEDDAVLLGGVTMQLDIRFWRGSWFWSLAVKAAVRFFRP